jgi:hypothetical protein
MDATTIKQAKKQVEDARKRRKMTLSDESTVPLVQASV